MNYNQDEIVFRGYKGEFDNLPYITKEFADKHDLTLKQAIQHSDFPGIIKKFIKKNFAFDATKRIKRGDVQFLINELERYYKEMNLN